MNGSRREAERRMQERAAEELMRNQLLLGALICVASFASVASAEEMTPRKVGDETRELLPIAADFKWQGKVHANAMQEGSPEMVSKGGMDCEWAAGNLWLTCKWRDTMGKGKDAMKWQGVFTVGYDYLAKEYRATIVDNFGVATLLTGTVGDNKLTLTTTEERVVDGKTCKGRMTFDWTDPKAIKWVNENSKDGGDYVVVEEVIMRPTKKEPLRPSA